MRLAFFGLPLAALLLQSDGHHIVLANLCRRGAPGERRLRRVIGDSPVWIRGERGEDDWIGEMRAGGAELLVSWFWTTELAMRVCEAAPHGGIGAHPSLLPRHRGPDPYFAAIDAGERITGITVHRIAAGYDTGNILAQASVEVPPRCTAWQLARRLDRPSLRLLRDTVSRMGRGERIDERVQDPSQVTWAPPPSDDDCAICWSWPTPRILRRIDALAPSPGAFTQIGDQIVTILRAQEAPRYPKVLEPGQAWCIERPDESDAITPSAPKVTVRRAVIRTGDTAIELDAGEIDGARVDGDQLADLVVATGEGR